MTRVAAPWPDNYLRMKRLAALGIPAFLNEYFKFKAVLIHRTPQKMSLIFDLDNNFIQVPLITTARGAAADLVSIFPSEFFCPFVHILMRDNDRFKSKSLSGKEERCISVVVRLKTMLCNDSGQAFRAQHEADLDAELIVFDLPSNAFRDRTFQYTC